MELPTNFPGLHLFEEPAVTPVPPQSQHTCVTAGFMKRQQSCHYGFRVLETIAHTPHAQDKEEGNRRRPPSSPPCNLGTLLPPAGPWSATATPRGRTPDHRRSGQVCSPLIAFPGANVLSQPKERAGAGTGVEETAPSSWQLALYLLHYNPHLTRDSPPQPAQIRAFYLSFTNIPELKGLSNTHISFQFL